MASRSSPSSLIGTGLGALLARRMHRLNDVKGEARRAPIAQRRALRGLLRKAARTEFGRTHDFAKLLRLPDDKLVAGYRAAAPIAAYDDLKPMLERMRVGGEPDICWPGVIYDWAQTSGTTAGDKYMPVSKELLAHNRKASFDIFAHASRMGASLSGLFGGKLLFLGGSTALETNAHGVRTGDLSGIVTPLIRWPLSAVYLPGKEVALESHWPTKIERMARACLDQDVRAVFGMASWGLVVFEKMLEIAKKEGRSARTVRDLWPNLRLFVHGGVRYAPFDPRVRTAWSGDAHGDDIPQRLEVYPASEAFVAMQDAPNHEAADPTHPPLRLITDAGVFYEFIPAEEANSDNPRAFAIDEVEPDVRYVVALSSPAGLWRYVLGDVVSFDSVPAQGGVPRLRIVGRHRLFMNTFGENIIVEHIENAVIDAQRAVNVTVGEFTAAPIYPRAGGRPGIELAVEWDGTREAVHSFAVAFDESIKRQNNDYIAKRTGGLGMDLPVITPLAMGAFHRWMDLRGKLGGQHKCPRCANHRDFIDGVRTVVGINVFGQPLQAIFTATMQTTEGTTTP